MTRWARPPGEDPLWYFEIGFVMVSVSSLLKAARSVADRKRTSVSTSSSGREARVSIWIALYLLCA